MISLVDQHNTGFVHFNQFKKVVAEKKHVQNMAFEDETIQAYTGMLHISQSELSGANFDVI